MAAAIWAIAGRRTIGIGLQDRFLLLSDRHRIIERQIAQVVQLVWRNFSTASSAFGKHPQLPLIADHVDHQRDFAIRIALIEHLN